VSKQGHVEDLVQAFVKKAQIKDEIEAGRIRVYEIHNHKFFRELVPSYPVLSINDYVDVIAERVPEEEIDAPERDFIKVIHFQNDPSRVHGIPFKFLLKDVRIFCTALRYELRLISCRVRCSPTPRNVLKNGQVSKAKHLRRSNSLLSDGIKSL
jgi:ubiquitin carboxyl-terminal hydrolase 7